MTGESEKQTFHFTLNGQEVTAHCYPMERLLDVLRENLDHTSPKEGCGEGECGTCAVLLDDQLVHTCLVPIAQVEGREVATVEILSKSSLGKKIQQAFWQYGGAQCGICTPGMLLASYQLLKQNPQPTLEEVQEGLAGNLCRCTGYAKIFESVLEAAKA